MILLRHGQSEFNLHFTATRRDPGIRDPRLTPLGHQQAAAAAEALRGKGITRILASPYTRALQTAAPIARALETLAAQGADVLLVAGASAVVDRRDVGPAGIVAAGGEILHFGMPVDPGNLITLGRIGERPDPGQGLQPVLAGHVMVQGDDIDAALLDSLQPALALDRGLHDEAAPLQSLLDETREPGIVVDIEDAERPVGHAASGTWITEKNSPSWRMAFAKPS